MEEKIRSLLNSFNVLFPEVIQTSNITAIRTAKNQADASIVMSAMGLISYIMVMIDSKSNFSKKASTLLENLFSGFELLPLLSFSAFSFLLLSSTMRCLEVSEKDKQKCNISLRIANTGINGFSSFMIPVTSMLLVIGVAMLLSLIYLPQEVISSQKISYSLAFFLMIFTPFLVGIFIWIISLFSSIANSIKSISFAIVYFIFVFIFWFSSLAQFIK